MHPFTTTRVAAEQHADRVRVAERARLTSRALGLKRIPERRVARAWLLAPIPMRARRSA